MAWRWRARVGVALVGALAVGGCTAASKDGPAPASSTAASPTPSTPATPAALPAVVSAAEERAILSGCQRVPVDRLDRIPGIAAYRVVALQADRYGRSVLLRHPRTGAYAHCVTGLAARLAPVRVRPPERAVVETSEYLAIQGWPACGPGDGKTCTRVLLSGAGVLPSNVKSVTMSDQTGPAGRLRLVDGRWLYRQIGEIPEAERLAYELTATVSPAGGTHLVAEMFPDPEPTLGRWQQSKRRINEVVQAHSDPGRYVRGAHTGIDLSALGLGSQSSLLVQGMWVESVGGRRAEGPVAIGVFGKDAEELAPGPKFERPCPVTPHSAEDSDFRWTRCWKTRLPDGRTLVRAENDLHGLRTRGVALELPKGRIASVTVRTGWSEQAFGDHTARPLPEIPFSWEVLTAMVTDPRLAAA
jgi:hypothetical protein